MKYIIGIRHEDKYVMERRVALVPFHIRQLTKQGIRFEVQKSAKRIFKESEFEQAGAEIKDKIQHADVIFGVKEMPIDFFESGKTYIFFSHVIKGQSYNMPMLKAMMAKKCQLIDYEKITNDEGRRLIFFGRFAGLAGMINSLWSYGQRLKIQGIDTPFVKIKQSHLYNSLDEALKAVSECGLDIAKNGLPDGVGPVVIGFTGYGNVSKGAQEIANLLPSIEISPEQLLSMDLEKLSKSIVYKVVFKEKHISEPVEENQDFELSHYYKHPEAYRNSFEKYVPRLSILMNCMYWDTKYPRIVTKDFLEELYANGEPKLKVIGDVTCDPDGSIECTHKGTEIEDPVFVYNPKTRAYKMGFEGDGVLVMAVDILPSELPRESSEAFSDALFPFVKAVAETDFGVDFDQLKLLAPLKRALILHQGELTPDYVYLKKFVE
ncbi:MAG: bifunctional lysine ketoglutarate reductase /saccharopine dehydrogenase family protein [Bacteroidales bacterium]|jgi:alpha-aminoadipic semialdehyde synthase|nr:bifunctional lysine ketoglutarate reductase /saccharopine dehydrogenase family protein [Bacteroidales bacterium]